MKCVSCDQCPEKDCVETQRKLVKQVLRKRQFATEEEIGLYFMQLGAKAAEIAMEARLILNAQPVESEN